jgi:hypothetical protein
MIYVIVWRRCALKYVLNSVPCCTNHAAVWIAEFMRRSPIHEIVTKKKLAFANNVPCFRAILNRSAYNNSFNFWLWLGEKVACFRMEKYFWATLIDIVNKWNVTLDLCTGSVTSFCKQMMNLTYFSCEVPYNPFIHLSPFFVFHFNLFTLFVFPLWMHGSEDGFRNMASCSLGNQSTYFARTRCLHLQGRAVVTNLRTLRRITSHRGFKAAIMKIVVFWDTM